MRTQKKSYKLLKIERTVLDFIRTDQSFAEDDRLLIARVWYSQGWNSDDKLIDNLRRVTDAQVIKRARRHLFEMGLIQYSEAIMSKRHREFVAHRNKYSKHGFLKRLYESWK